MLLLGLADEKMKRVKKAKEMERNQKSLAQKRSELLQEEPIIPNLANVESKLKTIFVSRDKSEEQVRLEAHRKRSTKPPGKVTLWIEPNFTNLYLFNILAHLYWNTTYLLFLSGTISWNKLKQAKEK